MVQVIYIDPYYEDVSEVDDQILMQLIFTLTLLNILMLTRTIILCALSLGSALLHA